MQKENIIINETLDGKTMPPGYTPPAQDEQSRSTRSRRERSDTKPSDKASDSDKTKVTRKADPYIWAIYITLLLVSILEQFSASSSQIRGMDIYAPLFDHLKFLVLGLVVVIVLQKMHYGHLSRWAWVIGVICFGALIFATFFGENVNGASRAINLGGISIQPPELIKLAGVILLATILGKNQEPGGVSNKGVITVAILVIVTAGLLWINGLTNTIIVMAVSVAMFLIGGIQWKKLGYIVIVYGMLGGMLLGVKYLRGDEPSEFEQATQVVNGETEADHQIVKSREKTHENRSKLWLKGVKPTDSITDYNRQAFFARMAQAHGGPFGRGIGNSRESSRLPLAFSDYIFSIIVEDTGFAGGVFLLVIYLFLVARAGKVASKCKRAFPAFLIMGCAVLIVFQALVHMAISTGVAPVSGQPLPLISKGGTSVLVMSAAIGIMLSVSRYAVTGKSTKLQQQTELMELPEDMRAENFSHMDN